MPKPLNRLLLISTCYFAIIIKEFIKVRLLAGRGKKCQISRDFQGQIRGQNGWFGRNFARNFRAQYRWKTIGKECRFCESFPRKFHWKAIGFALIWGKFSMKLQCSSDISEPKYTRNTRQPNTRICICIYANTRIQCMRVCLINMYELTYCFFFC